MPLWPVGSNVVSGWLQYWGCFCLYGRAVLVLKGPWLGPTPLSTLLSFPGQLFLGFPLLLLCFPGLLFFDQESVWGFFLLNFSWALCTLFCCQSSSGSPFCLLDRSASSLLGQSLVLLRTSCPQERKPGWGSPCWVLRSFNMTWGDVLSMPNPEGMAGSFCLRVICGEGLDGLGVLSVPSSFPSCDLHLQGL